MALAILDSFGSAMMACLNQFMRMLGWVLAVGLYILIGLHLYAYFVIICPLLKQRLGTEFGMTWIAIGLILLYNIVFNHLMAMILKPSNPQDLHKVE
jgi:hypothetical protein